MVRWVYNGALLLFVIRCLPKWLWELIRHRKHRVSLLEKLGLRLPALNLSSKGPRIWVHSISVGETKAVAPLIARLREKIPNASIVISTITETGQEEAKRSIPHADGYFFLPFDFSWNIKRLIKHLKPDLLILVEGDFWFNLIDLAPLVVLVNGKISERSLSRFRKVSFFSKRLFEKIQLFCVQSERFALRFKVLGVDPNRIVVTGNLKFDQPFTLVNEDRFKGYLGIQLGDRVITIGSTHEPEEDLILQALLPLMTLFPTLKVLLVPRHPERFDSIALLLEKKGIPFSRFSNQNSKHERVILVDTMGILNNCYLVSELAIIGGSFIPHIGGHNVFESAARGVPVLFGPYMESQKDLADLVIEAGAGRQIPLEKLASSVKELLSHTPTSMREAGLRLADEVHGSTTRSWHAIEQLLKERGLI